MVKVSTISNAIYGVLSTSLNDWEKGFLREQRPFGMILFARNIESPAQVKSLVDEMVHATDNPQLLVLIDQEGGRVARLKPPHWPLFPAAERFAECFAKNPQQAEQAVYYNYRKIAACLQPLGINVDCAPMCDLRLPQCHDIVGDRAFGESPQQVAFLAKAASRGLQDGGVLPIIKHIPGHGRALADSHESLPMVDTPHPVLSNTDFVPFRLLNDEPMAMTAHIRYTDLDPISCATHSKRVMDIIRTEIGFNGLIMTDDLSMKALEGDYTQRSENALAVGCDVLLHCNGKMDEMLAIAKAAKPFEGKSATRAEAVLSRLASLAVKPIDLVELDSKINALMAA